MQKFIIGLASAALLGMAIIGFIDGRDSAAELFQPEWYTPAVSWLYLGCNALAVCAVIRFAKGWEERISYAFGLLCGWFSPVMVAMLDNGQTAWLPHVLWALMLCCPVSIILDLIRKRKSYALDAPAT